MRAYGVIGVGACAVVGVFSLSGCSGSGAVAQPSPPGTLDYDRDVFSELLHQHRLIRRTWREIEGGIESVTESDDPRIAELIVDHVEAMKARVESGARLRQWDPIFKAVFDAAEAGKLQMAVERTGKGVRVRETSSDPAVVAVIRSHAVVVSAFVENGPEEATRPHQVP